MAAAAAAARRRAKIARQQPEGRSEPQGRSKHDTAPGSTHAATRFHKLAVKDATSTGYLFQAELRGRLTEQLRVEWTEVNKGSAEIVGVPRDLAIGLSKRREEITKELERLGRSGSAREAELAALSTRTAKLELTSASSGLSGGRSRRRVKVGA